MPGWRCANLGMVQYIVKNLGEGMRMLFITAYGLAQPVLPAVLVVTRPRSSGKPLASCAPAAGMPLAPFLLYAMFAAWRARPEKERRMLLWLAPQHPAVAGAVLRAGGRRPVG